MRSNYNTCFSGTKCLLVPYRPEHVTIYHDWMLDPYLLEMTGSEPLTMEEEIEMQKSWKEDEDKCTFIVLAKHKCCSLDAKCSASFLTSSGTRCLPEEGDKDKIVQLGADFITQNLNAMVGDVNLFVSRECESLEDDDVGNFESKPDQELDQNNKQVFIQAELDIMIAEKQSQQKGYGLEAVRLMMIYGAERLGITRFYVKIKDSNTASRHLFETRLGFKECNYTECFKEVNISFFVMTTSLFSLISHSVIKLGFPEFCFGRWNWNSYVKKLVI